MIAVSNRAVEEMKEQLVRKCTEAGLGLRILTQKGDGGRVAFAIKVDQTRSGDEVAESNGIRIIADRETASRAEDYRLDHSPETGGGFFLSRMEKAESGEEQDSGLTHAQAGEG